MINHYKGLLTKIKKSVLVLSFISSTGLTAQVTYTFTTAGNTGSLGPTPAQVTNAYQSTNLNGSVQCNGGIQTFTIPQTGPYELDITGASGGSTSTTYNRYGGAGSRMIGQFTLTAGDVLYILVGQVGVNGCGTGGGGGGTYVVKNNTLILIAAGGGGGATSDQNGANSVTITAGTNDFPNGAVAGGSLGLGGSACNVGGAGANHGGGGGGYLGNGFTSTANSPGGGGFAFVNGGVGGFGNAPGGFGGGGGGTSCTVGGGGGGGYSGGAGGQQVNYCLSGPGRTGGGGGGSYNAGTSQTNTPATNYGDGRVILRYLCNLAITSSGSNSQQPVTCGTTLTLTTNAVSNYTWSNGNSSSTSITVAPTSNTTYSIVGTTALGCSASAFLTVQANTVVPTMTISASSPSVCLGRTVTLSASGAVTYTWNNNVSNGTPFTPSITTNYVVSGSNGCGTSTAGISITVGPLPVSISSSPAVICQGMGSILSVTAAATSYSYMPVNVVNSSSLASVTPFSNTIYTVSVSDGTCVGSNTVAVTVNTVPIITINTSTTVICPGQSVSISAGGGLSYTWTPGNTVATSLTVSPAASQNYAVTGINSAGCTNGANVGIIVGTSPVINALASPAILCAGKSSTLIATGGTSYTWTAGPTTTNYIVSPASSQVYTLQGISATATCVANKTVAVTVVTGSITVSGTPSVCAGNAATLTVSGGSNYTWTPGGTGLTSISPVPGATTIYSVSGMSPVSSILCPATATIQVVVNPLPVVTAVSSRTVMCRKENVILTAGGASTYTWSSATATVSNNSTISVSAPNTGQLFYTVTGADALGCVGGKTLTVNVSGCVGLDEPGQLKGILIYPNPNGGEFSIQSSTDRNLVLYNELSQVILKISLTAMNEFHVSIHDLAEGVYFLSDDQQQAGIKQKIVVTQ